MEETDSVSSVSNSEGDKDNNLLRKRTGVAWRVVFLFPSKVAGLFVGLLLLLLQENRCSERMIDFWGEPPRLNKKI